MRLNVMNWQHEITKSFEVNLQDVLRIDVVVETGDETMTIIYKDGDIEKHSAYTATRCYYDGEYCIYFPNKGVNEIDAFMERKDTYWFQKR